MDEKIPIAKRATTPAMTYEEQKLEIKELRENLKEVVRILKGIYKKHI